MQIVHQMASRVHGMTASEEQRRAIDSLAEEKMKTMHAVLAQVGPDKHQVHLVQVWLEVARTVLAGSVSAQGEDSVSKG